MNPGIGRKLKGIALIALLVCGIFAQALVAQAAPVKIELFYYKQEIRDAFTEMVATFMKANPSITIEMTIIPNEGLTILKNRLASGQAPDIIQLQSYTQIFEFAKAGYLLDLTKQPVLGKVVPSSKTAVTYNGKQYSLPMDMAGIGIIYNKELFKKAGIAKLPTTFPELQAVAATLQKAGITPFAGLLKANWSVGHFITMVQTSLIEAKGGDKALNDWFATMNAGTGSYGDPKYYNKRDLFKIMDFYMANMAKNAVEWDWAEQQAAFAKGEAAMMVQGLWSYQAAMGTNPKLDCGFIPFPVTANAKDTKFYADVDSTMAISAQSSPEKKAAALRFLEWLGTPEAIKMWTTKCNLTSVFKGADMSGMLPPFGELMTAVNKNGAYPWAFSQYPVVVFEDACKNGAQQYFFAKLTGDEVIKKIDELWKKESGK